VRQPAARSAAPDRGCYLPREVFFGRLGFADAFFTVWASNFGRFLPATSDSFPIQVLPGAPYRASPALCRRSGSAWPRSTPWPSRPTCWRSCGFPRRAKHCHNGHGDRFLDQQGIRAVGARGAIKAANAPLCPLLRPLLELDTCKRREVRRGGGQQRRLGAAIRSSAFFAVVRNTATTGAWGIEPEHEPYRVREGGSRLCLVQDPDR
jgi:hypothetical protein